MTNEVKNQLVAGACIGGLILFAVFGNVFLKNVERIVQVVERMEKKADVAIENVGERIDDVVHALGPLGDASVKKALRVVREIDEKEKQLLLEQKKLGEAATDGMKELGTAAKSRLLKYIENDKIYGTE